jgi:4-hydroxy-tetrahydrodipicolinate synthase
MPSALLAKIGTECARVEYVKVEAPPTSLKISELHGVANGTLTLFGGLNGQFLLEELHRGAVGTMPGSDMIPQFVRIWDHYRAGQKDGAKAEFQRLLPLIRYELQPGLGVSAMKHNLVKAGVIAHAAVRHPTRTLDELGLSELAELRAEIK